MSTTVRVRFHELDPYGHVNHAVYLTYLEAARIDHLAARGVELLRLAAETGAQLVVVGLEVDFLAAAVAGDELEVTCSVLERRRASTWFTQEIRRGPTVLVRARVRTATLDRHGRAARQPAALVAALDVAEVAR